MDDIKCKALKTELAAQSGEQGVSIDRFFDGNDDLASIGPNLTEHPGIDAFRDVFMSLLRRPDVQAVYARIYEVDPGDGCWPFTDTILVVGTISVEDLSEAVSSLQPSDIANGGHFCVLPAIVEKHGLPVLGVWWD